MTALYLCWNQRNRRFVGDEILIVFEGKDGWLDFSKNADDMVRYILLTLGRTDLYYEITPKCISDFSGKAWLLPAININKDGTLKPESKWKLGKP